MYYVLRAIATALQMFFIYLLVDELLAARPHPSQFAQSPSTSAVSARRVCGQDVLAARLSAVCILLAGVKI
jgi:hypothetical protein